MAYYIDKNAIVEEIERRIKSVNSCPFRTAELGSEKSDEGQLNAYNVMLSFIDTLEVKDVDFENEFNNFLDNIEGVPRMWHSDEQIEWGKDIARHFFELGLNTQQNIDIDITNIDKVIEENGVDPNSKEAKMFKESYYMALEKFKTQKGE